MIDVAFDFQAEAGGRDSDRYSPTLQEYHRMLWSKPLPNGAIFTLTKTQSNRLLHQSALGVFTLSSDRAVATFSTWKRMQHIVSKAPKRTVEDFVRLTDSIGGIIIWPSNQVDGLPTINAERGFNKLIVDRLDLTIECIRRYYLDETSPLFLTFKRYDEFFKLFGSFKGYIDFFLLQDAVSDDYKSVKIAPPFDNFMTSPVPRDVDEYTEYIAVTSEFINSRNKRILGTCREKDLDHNAQ